MAAVDRFKFLFEKNPSWRDHDHTTGQMINDIATFRREYEGNTYAKKFSEEFARAMTVDYIHHLNVGEMVGTQTQEDTEAVLNFIMTKRRTTGAETDSDVDRTPKTKEERESINTYQAMTKLQSFHSEMDHTGILTVQLICDVHTELMSGLHLDAGQLRKKDVYTMTEEGVHFYPEANASKDRLYTLIDHHNLYMENRPKDKDTEYMFKCAALLLFSFVDAHPFSDGNGRMCRLLANYVLSLITPFPVGLYHKKHPGRSERKDYIDAIVHCRKHPDEGPGKLASMLVEGAWRGWKSLFENVTRRGSGVTIGPIVVQKSKMEKTRERVDRMTRGKALAEEKVMQMVSGVTEAVDVSALTPNQYVEKEMECDGETISLHIFK